jgi:hypothetical protein
VFLRLAYLLVMVFYSNGDRRKGDGGGCNWKYCGSFTVATWSRPHDCDVDLMATTALHICSGSSGVADSLYPTSFCPLPSSSLSAYTMSSPSKKGTIRAGEFDHLPDALAVHITRAIQDYHTLSGDERSKRVAEHCRALKSSMRAAGMKVAGDFLSVRIIAAVPITLLIVSVIQAFKAHVAASARPAKHEERPLYRGKAYTWQDTFEHMWRSEIADKAAELSGSRPGSAQFIARYKDATKEVKDSLSQDDKAQVARTHERWNKFGLDPDVQAK